MDTGTGKTRTSLAYIIEQNVAKTLVVCPKSVIDVWRGELRKVRYHRPTLFLDDRGTVKDKANEVKRFGDGIIVVNYDIYWRKPLRDRILEWQPDAVILDEAHQIRNRGPRKSRFAHTLGDKVRHAIPMTGTPAHEDVSNLWSIYRFADPMVFGRRWQDFRDRYLLMGGYLGHEIVGYRHLDEIHAKVDATSYQCSRSDVLDLPEWFDEEVPITLSPETRRMYDRMAKDAIIEIEQAEGEGTAVARTVLTQLLRLQQITSGFVRTVDDRYMDIGNEKARTTAGIAESLMAERRPLVVFVRFRRDMDLIERELPKGTRVARFSGAESAKRRRDALDRLNTGQLDVLLCEIKTGSLGIDMTAADTAVFHSVGFSLTDYSQARDRLHRWGQENTVRYYRLVATDTVDEVVYNALSRKLSMAETVTSIKYALTKRTDEEPVL